MDTLLSPWRKKALIFSLNSTRDPPFIRMVFSSDGVGVGVVSGVISVTESESEESERFHFFRLRLRLRRLRSLLILRKPDCRSRKQQRKDKIITMHVPRFVIGLVLRIRFCFLLVSGNQTLLSLHCKMQARMRILLYASPAASGVVSTYEGLRSCTVQ